MIHTMCTVLTQPSRLPLKIIEEVKKVKLNWQNQTRVRTWSNAVLFLTYNDSFKIIL